jgi:hypothetical protein
MHVSYINKKPVDYLDMAVRNSYQPGNNPKIPNNEVGKFSRGIDDLVRSGQVPKSEITKNPRKAIETIETLTKLLNDFYKDPKKYDSLKSNLAMYGRYLREPSQVGVFDDNKDAVARTDTKDAIEANINFDYLVRKIASQYGMKKEWAEEFVLTHELAHMAQPEKILSAKPQPIIAEYDNELMLRTIFTNKAMLAKTREEKNKYTTMANAANHRANGYEQVLKQYVSNSYRKAA